MRYFIVTYYEQASGKYNEDVRTDNKIRNRHQQNASLILDFKERKVVKCRIEEGMERDFDKICNFYKNHYASIIMQLEAEYPVIKGSFVGNNQQVQPIPFEELNAAGGKLEVEDDAD